MPQDTPQGLAAVEALEAAAQELAQRLYNESEYLELSDTLLSAVISRVHRENPALSREADRYNAKCISKYAICQRQWPIPTK
ncbi:hypothetical protein KOR34_52260 [Posidoniimonas corsicana]|uniref:Uncharacterized protein n=1 Tax=Posidoniimonas corsicana TaxID=1938618 RepID=A0A5C5UT06_9BACT|nr:hypothetical protein [Posidoniimonas corsicana]TWT29316.1 hypothetical protein KOR34_52260 [Posidoniimonas corsicana]